MRARDRLFKRSCPDRSRENSLRLEEGRFKLAIMRKFFAMRVMMRWHRLPREAVYSPSLETFKASSKAFVPPALVQNLPARGRKIGIR